MPTSSVLKKTAFHYVDIKVSLAERKRLKQFIASIFTVEGKKLEKLDIIFCNDPYLLKMNREFLKHNFYTDVITFDLTTSGADIIGEIYISVDRINENAFRYQNSFKRELHRVIFHGILHLCGYNDKTPHQQRLIRHKEDIYLQKYFR